MAGGWIVALRSPFGERQEAKLTRTLVISIVLAAVIAAPEGRAQDAAPARFFIERIEVRNHKRVSPEVVIAESRLRAGSEYSESELRDASTRLSRLPFLLAAEFALEKGAERGRHVLVINIIETRSFFFRFDFIPIYSDLEGRHVEFDSTSHLGRNETGAAIGYRWFLGRRGALHVALIGRDHTELTTGYTAVAVGYTQYDLFGTRGFATVNIKHNSEGNSVSPQVVAGLPLSLNQTITLEYDENVNAYNFFFFGTRIDKDRMERVARATWSYNTTNHPFFPTTGTLLSVAPIVTWRDDVALTTRVEAGVPSVLVAPIHSTTAGVQATGVRYFELSDRTSVSGGLEVGFARFEQRADKNLPLDESRSAAFAAAQTTASRSLWSPERRAQGGDSRIELEMRIRVRQDYDSEYIVYGNDDSLRASIHWLRHSSWGNVRFGVGYAW